MAVELEAGFAKLQGEDFEYYMQTYSILLGRNSKKSLVDVDLSGLGGGMNISRHHARIYYDFNKKRFSLQVLGKNGCHVQGSLYHPGNPHVKLDSQYLLQIGDKKFYFLLPQRSILNRPSSSPPAVMNSPIPLHSSSVKRKLPKATVVSPLMAKQEVMPMSKKAKGHKTSDGSVEIRTPSPWVPHPSIAPFLMPSTHAKQVESRERLTTGKEALPMQTEEKEVVSAVATVLSDLCGPGEWMLMSDLHSELVQHYSSIWPAARVRKFLVAEVVNGANKGKAWASLMLLLKKFREHFVIDTRTKGRVTSEFVSLVSLLS